MKQYPTRILATLFSLLPFACNSDAPAAGKGGSGGGAGYGADAGASTKVTCGGTECTLPIGGGIERLKACCTEAGGCGLKLPNVSKCLPRDMPGNRASECPRPTFTTPGGDVLASCCGANGCGALDPFLGCIPNPEIGAPAAACTYDPTNDCSMLTGVTCDGAEDCPTGQRCCAKLQDNARYVEVGCLDSCAVPDGGASIRWLELCHAGDLCEDATFSCLASTILPAPLARCDTAVGSEPSPTADKSAHRVNCGANVCGAGEQCCVRSPHDPYCGKANEPCKCQPSGTDAGNVPGARDASGD